MGLRHSEAQGRDERELVRITCVLRIVWRSWLERLSRNPVDDPEYISRKIRKFRTDKFDTRNKRSFDSCKSCKRLVSSRLHDLHESQLPFVSRIEFIRSKLSNFSAKKQLFRLY